MSKYIIPLLFFSALWISCSDDNMLFEIGNDDVEVRTRLIMVDTFTVKSYTVMLDSIRTSAVAEPAIIIGNLFNKDFGTIRATSFFRVLPPVKATSSSHSYEIHENSTFDSIRFFMIYNKYYEGDTNVSFKLDLHQLSKELKPNTDGFFYNNDSIGAFAEPIGSVSFLPSPGSKDTVWISLDYETGRDLFAKMKDNEEQVTETEKFLELFQGFMLKGNPENQALLGFTFPKGSEDGVKVGIRVYYHYIDFSTKKRFIDFPAQATQSFTGGLIRMQFNRFTITEPLIPLPTSQTQKQPVSFTNNRSYVISGIGVLTRLEIPYLKNLNYQNENIKILNAELSIEPVSGTYTKLSLPAELSLNETDNSNRWGNPILPISTLNIDMLYQENTVYRFNITDFIANQLAKETNVIPAVLLHLYSDEFYRSGKSVILGSQHHENKVKLKVYYINVN